MKKRNEISDRFKWDFTHIFKTPQDWEKAFCECEKEIASITELKGTLSLSPQSLFEAYEKLYGFYEKLDPVADYAFLSKTVDGGNPEALTMCDRVNNLLVKTASASAFWEPELMKISKEKLGEFMKYEPLKKYAHIIEDAVRLRDHVLDEKSESIIAKIGKISSASSDAYNMFTNIEMKLPEIFDSNKNKISLTRGNFGVMRESYDRALREAAFEGMFGTYGEYINTIACLYGTSVKQDNLLAELRGYKSAREASLSSSNVPEAVYDALIEAVHKAIPSVSRYLKLRKKALGLEKLDVYDLYTPIVEDIEYPMPYETACELVLKSVAPLGEEYQNIIRRAYQENWIDVYETKGKEAGAFSAGIYGVHPFIKLNFADSLDDAFTLAHELGHAMHSYLSSQKQDYPNHNYRLIVAEVASTCNEVLLTKYLLEHEADKKRRAYILNHFLEGFRTTVFRQTLFAEFEHEVHRLEASGASINAECLNKLYTDLVKLYYPEAEFRDTLKYEWSFIPHFYNAYYVYQYATGFSAAVAIASKLLKTKDPSNYIEFLSAGGSDYPLNELKIAGIDLCSPDVVTGAMKVFDETIDELEKTESL